MEISNKTIEVLKNAGWYEGRKIDISENIKFLEERGFEVLESAMKFMEEFGELKINVGKIRRDGSKKISKHSTCIKETVGVLDNSCFGLSKYVDEKVTLIGELYSSEIRLFISESGRVFDSIGWVGDSVWEAFDNIINEKGTIIWDKFNE
ncbi:MULTISPECIES: SUKH-3 domain-containing protein [unclassified Clostridium]|uniref:SUKH-3 domain-containing protein n=1 Tax=unclassified Clostridium TaxID=2614128 RepID=UPI0020799B1B|nr:MULTISPECIES: SUKH-3 domain-containing protein [unclassified Clostridium]